MISSIDEKTLNRIEEVKDFSLKNKLSLYNLRTIIEWDKTVSNDKNSCVINSYCVTYSVEEHPGDANKEDTQWFKHISICLPDDKDFNPYDTQEIINLFDFPSLELCEYYIEEDKCPMSLNILVEV